MNRKQIYNPEFLVSRKVKSKFMDHLFGYNNGAMRSSPVKNAKKMNQASNQKQQEEQLDLKTIDKINETGLTATNSNP